MSRAGALIGITALLGLGGYAALPDDEPAYLGDMPSIIEQAEAAPFLPQPPMPPPPMPPPPSVDGPDPVVLEAAPAIGPPVAGERVPAPVTDAPQGYRPGASDKAADGPSAGVLDLLGGLPLPCVDTFEPGIGTVDCLTGEVLLPDPGLPIDPCTVEVPLPISCPVPLPD